MIVNKRDLFEMINTLVNHTEKNKLMIICLKFDQMIHQKIQFIKCISTKNICRNENVHG